jgi:hypothetical protein
METKDFEKALPTILDEIGMQEDGYIKTEDSVVVRVPEGFDFKSVIENILEKSGINIIYADCKTEEPQSVTAKMAEAGWGGVIWRNDEDRAKLHEEEPVTSILVIDHLSDLEDQRAITAIGSILKVNKDCHICGKKNIPVIVTFSSDEGMGYFYLNTSIKIIDERYWK